MPFWSSPSGDDRKPAPRSIPSLDGLRAVSVVMVIISHYMGWSTMSKHGLLHTAISVLGQGGLGVTTFFVISGFLITTLLLNEMDHHGNISLSRFYFRRSLRIFPPYYVYLAIAAIVAYRAHQAIPTATLATAAAYISNYYPYIYSHPETTGWFVGHTWSLSVEEQFYLLWPLMLVVLPRRLAFRVAVALLFVVPVLRLLTAHFVPVYQLDEQWYRLFHTTFDTLLTGCVMAFLVRQPGFQERVQRWFHPALLCAALLCVGSSTFLLRRTPVWFESLFGTSLTTLSIALLVLYTVIRHDSLAGRVLNWTPLRHVGQISYSLYLWQQMFLGPDRAPSRLSMVALAFICAELSYWIVEQPSLKLRTRLERMLGFTRNAGSTPPSTKIAA